MAQPAIAIRGLQKSFSSFTLGPLDLTVPQGAIYGLIGPNGAGKTTTIDLIMGMGLPDAGAITVLGLDHVRDEGPNRVCEPRPQFQCVGPGQTADQFLPQLLP